MRIVQHKTPSAERPAKDPVEVIGLSVSIPTYLVSFSYFPNAIIKRQRQGCSERKLQILRGDVRSLVFVS